MRYAPDMDLFCSALDSARTAISTALLAAWEGQGAVEALRNRFVTGDWEEGRKRAEATPGEGDDEDGAGEVGGDVGGRSRDGMGRGEGRSLHFERC